MTDAKKWCQHLPRSPPPPVWWAVASCSCIDTVVGMVARVYPWRRRVLSLPHIRTRLPKRGVEMLEEAPAVRVALIGPPRGRGVASETELYAREERPSFRARKPHLALGRSTAMVTLPESFVEKIVKSPRWRARLCPGVLRPTLGPSRLVCTGVRRCSTACNFP